MHLIKDLAKDITRLGVAKGDTLMVHASLRSIGETELRAEGVLEALERAVGEQGTLMMVLGAENPFAWVDELDESERPARLEGSPPFDALQTSADPDVGVLAEVFRRRPKTVVSNHPEGRFAASGHKAAELVADPPWDDYFGPGSPLEKLVKADGKVLRLGADPDTVTLLHYAEYLAEVPNKRRVRRFRLISTQAGPKVRVVESLDDSNGIVDHPGEDYFKTILRGYLATGRVQVGAVGNAPSELIHARDILPFALDWMSMNLGARS